jgi:hypothetical protein
MQFTTSCWGHAVLHAADLIQLRPTAYHTTSPLHLVRGNPTNISHLQKFGCAVYTPYHRLSEQLWDLIGNWASKWDINPHRSSHT